jgi:hypothetical protein
MRDYYGPEQLRYVLINKGGHGRRIQEQAADCITRYAMEGVPRVRFDDREFADHVSASFGQFGYGQFVIDKEGILRGVDVRGKTFDRILEQACGNPSAIGVDGFALTTLSKTVQSGRPGRDYSNRLAVDHESKAMVKLTLPEGWHVGGAEGAESGPTEVFFDYLGGMEVGALQLPEGASWASPVKIIFPLRIPAGSVIGEYVLHGRLRFVACDENGCLPPMEIPWKVEVEVL